MSDNLRDSVQHGTHAGARKTHCKQGHALSGPNLRINSRQRICRACSRAGRAVIHARRKGITLDRAAVADQNYAKIMRE